MDIIELLRENWVSVTGALGVAIAWFVEKKSRKEDLKIKQGSAMETMQSAYDRFVEDAQNQYNLLYDKIGVLETRERTAISERVSLQENIKALKKEMYIDKENIQKLEIRISEYEIKIKSYEEQLTKYKLRVESLTRELSKYKK